MVTTSGLAIARGIVARELRACSREAEHNDRSRCRHALQTPRWWRLTKNSLHTIDPERKDMVYRGKPSKACLPCRKRRLICDLNPDGCASCRRAQLICCGYRDTQSLQVNDETSVVRARVKNRGTSTVPQTIAVPVRHQAKDLFYYNYVVGTAQPLDFLNAFYEPNSTDGEHIFQSIDAVSLAYLNFQRRAATVEREARRHYVAAIKLTRSAIRNPETATKDSTILSVLLLDMYEKIANAQVEHGATWAAHINGALALVDLRGDRQYSDPVGLRILIRLTTNMIINCVATNKPIPPQLSMLRQVVAAHFSKPGDPKRRESDLMLDWVRLRYSYSQGEISGISVVDAAKDLDSKFRELSELIEPPWGYEVVDVIERSEHHFESYHHFYQFEETARMWNVLRLTRIMLNELICGNCSAKDLNFYQAQDVIIDMVRQICATVPQFIRGVRHNRELVSDQLGSTVELRYYGRLLEEDESQIAHHLPCYRLIYPLFVAAQSQWAPQDAKTWIESRLNFMAEFHGIENAAKVVKVLQDVNPMDPWQIYKVLGSYAFVC